MALRSANEELEQRVEERTAALQKLAYFDVVTRLPNQLLLLEELKAMIEKSEDTDGDTVVVLVDIDRFSFINETMGYDAGTELLRSIGNRLSRTFCDEAGNRMAVVGRFGADEFAMLVPGIENDEEIRELTELVCQGRISLCRSCLASLDAQPEQFDNLLPQRDAVSRTLQIRS